MKTKKYIGKKEYVHLTDLLKTYAHIIEVSDESPLLRKSFQGSKLAIATIMLSLDLSYTLTLEDCIIFGDMCISCYNQATTSPDRIYWTSAYNEILTLIEKYFDIKLRRDI